MENLPFGLQCRSDGPTTTFRYYWFDAGAIATAVVGGGWWYLILKCFHHGGRWDFLATVQSAPFMLLIVFMGLSIAYAATVAMVNRTEIDVTDNEIRVRNGPLPWIYRNHLLHRADLLSLEVGEHGSRSDDEPVRYRLRARLHSGQDIPITRPVSAGGRARLQFIADDINSGANTTSVSHAASSQ